MRRIVPLVCAGSWVLILAAGMARAQQAEPPPAGGAPSKPQPTDMPALEPAPAPIASGFGGPGPGPGPGYGPSPGVSPGYEPYGEGVQSSPGEPRAPYVPAPGYYSMEYEPHGRWPSGPWRLPPDLTAHNHDSFYLGLSIGLAYMRDAISYDPDLSLDTRARGSATELGILLGGTPARGLVIGGGLLTASAPHARLRPTVPGLPSEEQVTLSMLGAFLDWYPNPREGIHLQGFAGLAAVDTQDALGRSPSRNPTGIGLGFGVGQEWWVGDQWSLGIVGRLLYAHATVNDTIDAIGASERHSVIVPAVLFGATYH